MICKDMLVVWNKETLLILSLKNIYTSTHRPLFEIKRLYIYTSIHRHFRYYNLPVGRYEFLGDPVDTKVELNTWQVTKLKAVCELAYFCISRFCFVRTRLLLFVEFREKGAGGGGGDSGKRVINSGKSMAGPRPCVVFLGKTEWSWNISL